MNFYCIADEDTVRGFRLAGIEGQAVVGAQEAVAALDQAMARPDCGVVVLGEAAANSMREHVEKFRLERDKPLIVEVPGPGGPAGGRKGLRQFVQEAVGIRVDREGA